MYTWHAGAQPDLDARLGALDRSAQRLLAASADSATTTCATSTYDHETTSRRRRLGWPAAKLMRQ